MKLNKTIRKAYKAPAIVYQGKVGTRAGSVPVNVNAFSTGE